jgi:trafficking protein particle complex subunit 4
MILSLWIINKSGSLVFQRDLVPQALERCSANDYLVMAGTLHSVHAILSRLGPGGAKSSGLLLLETESFVLHCRQSPTGVKFLLFTDPSQSLVDPILRKVHELYADMVLKNPFYTPEMPIRCELFDASLQRFSRQYNPSITAANT